ncbi:DUF4259 domain-containing protein [Streptomyces sp. or20]|uniref:DUF4259 domain-containing protein n=1 Tax=Streptomyces sp. or20 TaxID=1828016 RepID=UPI00211D409E|nr:DUF4259 domain-containing protein [Streptomyces sp. or20]
MGTWDIGPFDNDTAADFADELDEAAREEREAMIRGVLKRAVGPADFLGIYDGERAVGAAGRARSHDPGRAKACRWARGLPGYLRRRASRGRGGPGRRPAS